MKKIITLFLMLMLIANCSFSRNLADGSANEKTKKLYDFMLANYGTKIFSGSMAKVSWNLIGAKDVYKRTGKWPAMNTFDFINIDARDANENNYDSMVPVIKWAKSGGICSFMWHFCAPAKKDMFYTSNTTFMPSKALEDGTDENKYFYSRLDTVANIFLKLQSAGVVGIWRPWHEGAGNSSEQWFWWGREGATVYKKLWYAMWNYFQKKGVHNLIWVWGSQIHEYDDSEWYPGDEYVDIISDDLYSKDATYCNKIYSELAAKYPQKMITLAECGSVGTISDQWKAGAKWSYFTPWYDYNYLSYGSNDSWTTNAWWTDAMNQDYVINRDGVNFGDDLDSYVVPDGRSTGEQILYTGSCDMGSWSNTLQIGGDVFEDAQVGDTLRVYVSNVGTDAKAELDNTNWTGIVNNITVSGSYYDVPLTADLIKTFSEQGLRIKGTNYVITKVTFKLLQTPTAIQTPETSKEVRVSAIYDVCGKRLKAQTHGMNIIKYSDGKIKKVINK